MCIGVSIAIVGNYCEEQEAAILTEDNQILLTEDGQAILPEGQE